VSSKYEFIDGEKANYPITKMCDWIHVSRSGFYEWRDRPASATTERRAALTALIREIFDANDGTYGHRRVHAQLARQGVEAGVELVRSIMRAEGLVACQPRPYRATTTPDDAAAATADLLARDFTANAPGVKLVGDITYIPTWHGWLYLATVIDCHTKAVVGWSMASHMHASLVTDAIGMAAGNITLQDGCVFHSDRGSQYTSAEYRTKLQQLDVSPSVGRTGVCWDNALAESFFAALKNELVHRTAFPTRRHARRAIVTYIEGFYNRRRLHSALGYRTPLEVHTEYQNRQIAA
jgi:transposase InsO family protein